MIHVERDRLFPGFQWAEPLRKGSGLDVKRVGDSLEVTGLFPTYGEREAPSDLLSGYQNARKNRSIGKQSAGKDSPHIRFANADTDDKLIAFVGQFGPVVADNVKVGGEPPLTVVAMQDMKELRNERTIYRAALTLMTSMTPPIFDYAEAQLQIQTIADHIVDWPRQWKRESLERKAEPLWRLGADSLERVKRLSHGRPDRLLPPELGARIVICELVNIFRPLLFPNALELNASIRHGIRPLLYAVLRREFLNQRDTTVCANSHCRDFFEVERAGQQFCTPECSRRQRQRDYWKNSGKKLRTKRLRKLGK
jgi:hypothetical protein